MTTFLYVIGAIVLALIALFVVAIFTFAWIGWWESRPGDEENIPKRDDD